MTTNQIAYHRNREEARHNLATEIENRRHNKRSEDASFDANASRRDAAQIKAKASNYSTDVKAQVDREKLAEQKRHNITTEVISGVDTAGQTFRNVAGTITGGAPLTDPQVTQYKIKW